VPLYQKEALLHVREGFFRIHKRDILSLLFYDPFAHLIACKYP